MNDLLRLEAVNLSHSILDTDDLSTRRGGSYLLLQAVRDVQAEFANELEPISTGASTGLFKVLPSADPKQQAAKVAEWLFTHPDYRHASFVVVGDSADGFKVTNETCIAKGRWQQMQSLSVRCAWDMHLPVRAQVLGGRSPLACELDGVRPAVALDPSRIDQPRWISASVHARRGGVVGGQNLRQSFYRRELTVGVPVAGFTNDLGTLAKLDHTEGEGLAMPRNLDNKIAIFYADGNGFGAVQAGCGSAEDLAKWDDSLRQRRRTLLHRLLAHAQARRHWRTTAGIIRLETLMWGGDELTFVVPAWCGLELAALFFKLTADWRYPADDTGRALQHATALVFAHAKAPIRRLERLAHDLVDQTKQDGDKARNTLAWTVLESFDHTGSNLDDYLQRRYPLTPCPVSWSNLRLDAAQLQTLLAALPALREVLPRSAIVRALRLLVSGQRQDRTGALHPLLLRSCESVDRAVKQVGESDRWQVLWQALGGGRSWAPQAPSLDDIAPWTLLLELWDYTLPELPELPEPPELAVAENPA